MQISQRYFISVVVPVYNKQNTIEQCLESLINQNYEEKEIIVIDDGSTDKSLGIIHKIAKKYPLIKVIQTEHKGISHARNMGIKNAGGLLIAFAEADAIYDVDWLKYCSEHFTDPKVAGVLSPHYVLNSQSFVSKCIETFWIIRFSGNYKPFAAYVYRKEVVEDVGGFDEQLAQGEDRDLGIRVAKLGFKFAYENRTKFWHHEASSIQELVSESFWRGNKRIAYCIKHPKDFPYLSLGIFTLLFVSLLLSVFDVTFLILPFGIVSIVIIYLLWTVREGRRLSSRRKYLLPLAFLMLIERFFFILGFILGMLSRLINSIVNRGRSH